MDLFGDDHLMNGPHCDLDLWFILRLKVLLSSCSLWLLQVMYCSKPTNRVVVSCGGLYDVTYLYLTSVQWVFRYGVAYKKVNTVVKNWRSYEKLDVPVCIYGHCTGSMCGPLRHGSRLVDFLMTSYLKGSSVNFCYFNHLNLLPCGLCSTIYGNKHTI